MSTTLRRSGRRLAAAATATATDAPPPLLARLLLLDLPTDLVVRVISCLDSPLDIARAVVVSPLFHLLAVEAVRLWARERGFELPAQPEGEGCAVRWLCFFALLRESNPPARAAAGLRHSLFIDGEGRLSSCGKAESWTPGLLGHGEGVMQLNTPTRLPSPLGGERAVSVSAGAEHSLALAADGSVWSWGGGAWGKLGHGDEQDQLLPKKIEAFAGQRVVAVSAGPMDRSIALTADGSVWSWGLGGKGELGHGDRQNQPLPKRMEALAGQLVVAVSAGRHHSLAITAEGAVWSWGCFGGAGLRPGAALGHGDRKDQPLPKKITVGRRLRWARQAFAGLRVVAVAAGAEHSLALAADGSVWSWGNGAWGTLGHGDRQDQFMPKKVEALAGQRVVAVSAGKCWGGHSFAITADGALFAWGNGCSGKLGHGDTQDQLLPKKVEAFAGQRVVAVSAGDEHSLALTANAAVARTAAGAVFTWGARCWGSLGHGDPSDPWEFPGGPFGDPAPAYQLLPKQVEALGLMH